MQHVCFAEAVTEYPYDIEIKLVDENGKKGETKNVTRKEM